jgi:2-iminobutanoate/2-iminopropanoate deaminase
MKKSGISLLFIIFLLTGYSQTTEKLVIQSPKAPKAIGPYSQAVMVGNTLYVSGNIALDPKTGLMDTLNLETETRRVMSNLGAVLNEAGMTYDNIVKATIYMTDINDYKEINTIYGEYFTQNPPAREAVQVVALPAGAHVEVSCIAVR